ncbi:hypothetical protein AB0L40_25395 [Patulibacter sp. NPDC049589]|uniref:hypothetical protein n=1 Tax=Patulibacter sp. NPDC049589 TaxID=3154731 RepID=UPI003424F0E0
MAPTTDSVHDMTAITVECRCDDCSATYAASGMDTGADGLWLGIFACICERCGSTAVRVEG